MEEINGLETIDGVEYMRLMQPMFVEESCLVCHGHQGHVVGDIRGGISMSVPMANLRKIEQGQIRVLALAHTLIWAAGILANRRRRRRLTDATPWSLREDGRKRDSAALFSACLAACFNFSIVIKISC